MRGWPRKVYEDPSGWNVEGPDGEPRLDTNDWVIPADLGREMYQMLKDARFSFSPDSRLRQVVDEVLARYEAEVGR